jgi:acetyl/propionyl-CoA carboxylase alpha subunit
VPIHYDPMLGKLIVWGEDRAQALDRLGRALAELRIEGVATGVPLFLALLRDQEFRTGAFDLAWLDRKLKAGELALPVQEVARDLPFVAAAPAEIERGGRAAAAPPAESARSLWSVTARREALRKGGGAT